jgi:hypothetical protein
MKKIVYSAISIFSIFIYTVTAANAIELKVITAEAPAHIALSESGENKECEEGDILSVGDMLYTGEGGYAVISVGGDPAHLLKVRENSTAYAVSRGDEKMAIMQGSLLAVLEDWNEKEEFYVNTPFAVCGVRGTGWSIKNIARTTLIEVFDGKVYVTTAIGEEPLKNPGIFVEKGYSIIVSEKNGILEKEKLDNGRLSELREEAGLLVEVSREAYRNDISLKEVLMNEKRMQIINNKLENADRRVMDRMDRMRAATPMPSPVLMRKKEERKGPKGR